MNSKMKAMIVLLLTGLLVAGCDLVPTEPEPQSVTEPVSDPGVIAEANLVPAEYVALRFALPGPVAEIAVEAGSEVEEGQVLKIQRIKIGSGKLVDHLKDVPVKFRSR